MTLDRFFTDLDEHKDAVPIDELVRLLKRLKITRADVEQAVKFGDDKYRRNVLKLGSGYAALVLCWKSGQASPIHDHRGSACGVLVLDGTLTETRYRPGDDGLLSPSAVGTMNVGDVCGSYDTDIHVIGNTEPAGHELVTLHVYTPPLKDYHVYRLGSTEVEVHADEETLAAQRELAGRA